MHSDSVNMFKEVSSRDGGLIDSEETRQLHAYFDAVERRLERYVSGVLWGEAFCEMIISAANVWHWKPVKI